MSSYKKINYGLRPAKSAERKMICELLRKIDNFNNIENYQYIGFGSTYFSDFILFHRALGIQSMISIEREEDDSSRFHFNKPFACVDLKFGDSKEILPTLSWDSEVVTWLDYDESLDGNKLFDVKTIFKHCKENSVILITVNAHSYAKPDTLQLEELGAWRLEKLKSHVGENKVPSTIKGNNLKKWGLAVASREIINNEIFETIQRRNSACEANEKVVYKQLINFNYQDGACMLTVGGILLKEDNVECFNNTFNKQRLEFISEDNECYEIVVPKLTLREMRKLDEQLPCDDITKIIEPSVPYEDKENYSKIYRYFPTFSEVEL